MGKVNPSKVAIIGCGFVGSASAFALMQSGLFNEMVLLDANHDKAEGEARDIAHGLPFVRPMKLYAGGYDDIADAAIIVITAGANQKPDETRLDLVHKNVAIFESIIPEITSRDYEGILLVVANPVDILTYTALKLSGYPENRVIGSGTVLDSARLKYHLASTLVWTAEACMPSLWESMEIVRSLHGAVRMCPVCRSISSVRCADITITWRQRSVLQRKSSRVRMESSREKAPLTMASQCL